LLHEHGELSSANECIQPAFTGSYKFFTIPFGSHVTGFLSLEHHLVKKRSMEDRFVEGIYLRADHNTPCIRTYCITSGSQLLVQDFKPYLDEFSFQDSPCVLRCTPVILFFLAKMYIHDAYDDILVVKEETALHSHIRAQTRATDAAKVLDDPIILTTSSNDQTEKSIDENAPLPPWALATTTEEIALYHDLENHNELAIARAFSRHLVDLCITSPLQTRCDGRDARHWC